MLGPNQTEWLEALRSGEYQQGPGFLQAGSTHCCLGVACAVAEKHGVGVVRLSGGCIAGQMLNTAQPRVMEWLGLSAMGELDLSDMNDKDSLSFKEIADAISDNPEYFFKEVK